ncbi:hypothetical protein E2C01_086782 [Portunus trituberculatus]|uniref:Uncharacterized protein n=1 Tax=Portunus trituberculatus TaxID=210409 RepID=A0A5B7JAN4_PORTR|nr:hypothetical protein [Portunus trituberculatus]
MGRKCGVIGVRLSFPTRTFHLSETREPGSSSSLRLMDGETFIALSEMRRGNEFTFVVTVNSLT